MFSQASKTANILFPDSSCGNEDGHKILVAYGSKFGTTGEVAEEIGKALCRDGATVHIKWIKNVKNLKNYDGIIIGSAIQFDRWMPEAREFVKANADILSQLPVACFFTCLTLSRKTKSTERKAMRYSDKILSLAAQIAPVSVGRFAGALDYSKMSFLLRLIAKSLFLVMRVQESDYRDWDAIRSWAKDVHSKLNMTPTGDQQETMVPSRESRGE